MVDGTQPSTPESIGGWTLIERLGNGGMGEVFRASRDGVEAALKVVHPHLATDLEFRARFRREVLISQLPTSPNVAKVLDYDVNAARPWMATEFLGTETLQTRVERDGPLFGRDLDRLAADLADGLVALQQADAVHRDLKPSNVMLTPARAVLIDLGIARAAEMTTMTQTGVRLGSPGWMSPEQIDTGTATSASDVFGWAMCVAYGATGKNAFGAGPTDAVLFRIRHDPPALNGVAGTLQAVVRAALDKDPRRRPDARRLRRLVDQVSGDVAWQDLGDDTARLDSPTSAMTQATTMGDKPALQGAARVHATQRRPYKRWALAAASSVIVTGLVGAGYTYLVSRSGKADPSIGRGESAGIPRTTGTAPASGAATSQATGAKNTWPVEIEGVVAGSGLRPFPTEMPGWGMTRQWDNTTRVFDGRWQVAHGAGGYLAKFPAVYGQGCTYEHFLVRWKSDWAAAPIQAGYRDQGQFNHVFSEISSSGWMSLDGCATPIWRMAENTHGSFADVEYQVETFVSDPWSNGKTTPTLSATGATVGYGAIRLGMSEDALIQSGLARVSSIAQAAASADRMHARCYLVPLKDKGAEVAYDRRKDQVKAISFGQDWKTSKGIGIGSTPASVRAAYPDADWSLYSPATSQVRVSIGHGAQYVFTFKNPGQPVVQILMDTTVGACFDD